MLSNDRFHKVWFDDLYSIYIVLQKGKFYPSRDCPFLNISPGSEGPRILSTFAKYFIT